MRRPGVDKKYSHIIRKSVSLNVEEFDKIMRIAKSENRTFSNLVTTAVMKYEEGKNIKK